MPLKIKMMLPGNFITPALFMLMFLNANSQEVVTKVIRKGVNPVILTKTPGKDRSTYTLNQFKGRWQEVSRMDRQSNSKVEFTDTLFFRFTGIDDVFTKDGVAMSMQGKASIEPGNELVVAADVFDIRSLNNQTAVLDDREKYIHTLSRKRKFWYETLPSNSVTPEKFITPIHARSADLVGNWMVYRRDAEPGVANDRFLIKALNIVRVEGDNAYGSLTFFHIDKTDSAQCTITLSNEQINISSAKHSWQFNVYKANGSELVFGNGGLMYYSKPW